MKRFAVALMMVFGFIFSVYSDDFEKIPFYDNDGNLTRIIQYYPHEYDSKSEISFSENEIFDFLSNMCEYADEQNFKFIIKDIGICLRGHTSDFLIDMILEKYGYCYEFYYKENKFFHAILYFSVGDSNYIRKITYCYLTNGERKYENDL